jgi:hypothetical protein
MPSQLRVLEPDRLWVADAPFGKMGFEVGARMTAVRMPQGELLVHSPVALTDALKAELDAAGPVRWIVAPSRFHTAHTPEYARAYPQAEVCAVWGAAKSLRGVAVRRTLTDHPPRDWSAVMGLSVLRGSWLYDEAVLFHEPTRTLIVTDLCFNVPGNTSKMTYLVAGMLGIRDRFGPSKSFRWTLTDRAAARDTVSRLVDWDFDRVILSHGTIVETGGYEAFQHAFSWLVDK